MNSEAKACGCRVAVTGVYSELKMRDISEISAFDTAATIFRLHHPDVDEREARFTISKWLD